MCCDKFELYMMCILDFTVIFKTVSLLVLLTFFDSFFHPRHNSIPGLAGRRPHRDLLGEGFCCENLAAGCCRRQDSII